MSEPIYIFIEKAGEGPDHWLGVDHAGLIVDCGDTFQCTPEWTALDCLLVKTWKTGRLPKLLDELAPHLKPALYDYRVFLHAGGGSLSDNEPQKLWREADYLPLAQRLPPDRWARQWSGGGSQGQVFSAVLAGVVKAIKDPPAKDQAIKLPQPISDWAQRMNLIETAWTQATEFFSIHPKLRDALRGLSAITGWVEHGPAPGWAPLNEDALRRLAQDALIAVNAVLRSLHGERNADAEAIVPAVQAIADKPLDKAAWRVLVAAFRRLKL